MNILVKDDLVCLYRNREFLIKAMTHGGDTSLYCAEFIFQKDGTGAWSVRKDRTGFFNSTVPNIDKALRIAEILMETDE